MTPLLKPITGLVELLEPAADDLIPIIDVSEALPANQTKKVTFDSLSSQLINNSISNGMIPPIVSARQGGDAEDWNNADAVNDYVPGQNTTQCGIAQLVLANQSSQVIEVTYPQAFFYKPLCIVGAASLISGNPPAGNLSIHISEELEGSVKIHISLSAAVTATFNIPWLAVGQTIGEGPM
jgi:hypothetical protein